MKKFYTIYTIVIMVFILSIASAFAAVDLSLEDLQATKTAEAYSAVHLQFTITNTGDEAVITGLRIQPFTQTSYKGFGVYDLLYLPGTNQKPITELTVYKNDGTTRIETVQERTIAGKELLNDGSEQQFSQTIDSIQLFPGESIKLEHDFQYRDQQAIKPGQHQLGLRFVGYQQQTEKGLFIRGQQAEATSNNNEQLVTITVTKRAPLVESQGFVLGNYGTLKKNEYFIHTYQEYYEDNKLCTTIENNAICLQPYDGVHYPFTVNGKQLEVDWKAKLLYNWDGTFMESWLQKMLINTKVTIGNVAVHIVVDTGLLLEVKQ